MKLNNKTKKQLKCELEAVEHNYRNIESIATEWRNIFDSITDFVSLHDKDFRIVRVNKALADFVGVKPADLIGKYCYEVFHSLQKPIINCPHAETMVLKKTVHMEYYEPKFGLHFLNISSPLFDENGDIKGSVHIAKNITESKQLEEEKQKSHKLESIGLLAGGIAHDFNNILAGILNNVFLAKMHIDRESKEYKNLESAENAIYKATNLTRKLLTFSKGGLPVKKITSLIDIIRKSVVLVLSGSNVKCEYIVDDDLWPVEVDEDQMNQVIHNIVLNAFQAMPQGGTILIRIGNSSEPLHAEGKNLKVLIKDQGIGIEKEHLQKIFDPYFTTKEVGRGLGLSMVYSIINQHDGIINVDSEIGTGTTFTIYLPAYEKQINKDEIEEDTSAAVRRILIMDDEDVIRESVEELLTMNGYEVESAKCGEETIELYKNALESSKLFDVVILDLTIKGGMGGKDVLKKLYEIDPDVKAIVSSGYSDDHVMANYKEFGFNDVYYKASDSPEKLFRILNKIINNK